MIAPQVLSITNLDVIVRCFDLTSLDVLLCLFFGYHVFSQEQSVLLLTSILQVFDLYTDC